MEGRGKEEGEGAGQVGVQDKLARLSAVLIVQDRASLCVTGHREKAIEPRAQASRQYSTVLMYLSNRGHVPKGIPQ